MAGGERYSTEEMQVLENNSHRGRLAREILNNALWKEIYEETMEGLFGGWLDTDVNDIERIKDILLAGKAFRKVNEKLESIAEIGRFADEAKLQL